MYAPLRGLLALETDIRDTGTAAYVEKLLAVIPLHLVVRCSE